MSEWITPEEIAADAMDKLISSVGGWNTADRIAAVVVAKLQGEHRTIQQSFMRVFVLAMKEYSTTSTDMRNEAAVNFAKEVTEKEYYFPYI